MEEIKKGRSDDVLKRTGKQKRNEGFEERGEP